MTPEEGLWQTCAACELRGSKWFLCQYHQGREDGRDEERERCAKIANEKRSFSPLPNPSDMDLGWKRCAKAIEDAIRK